MSNNLLTVPKIFDTVGASSAIAYPILINSLVWDSGTSGAVADVLLIHDAASGNIIFMATLAVAKDVITWSPAKPVWVKGFYLTTMSHGTLLVF